MFRHRLKDEQHALPESLPRCVEDDEGEEISANRVNEPEFRPEENYGRSEYDSDRIEKVSKDM